MMWQESRFRQWAGEPGNVVVAALGAVLLAALVWFWRDPSDSKIITTFWYTPLMGGASLLAWRTALHPRLHPRVQRVWRAFAMAWSAYTLASVFWSLSYGAWGTKPTHPIVNMLYLSFYPLMCWGIITYTRTDRGRRGVLEVTLDILVVLIPGSMLMWTYVLQPVVSGAGSSTPLSTIVLAAYPLGGLALLTGLRLLVSGGQPLAQFDEMPAAMEREITRLSNLLDEILTAFRTQEGRLQVRRLPVDLARVVALAAGPLQAAGGAHRLWTREVCPGPVWVQGDPDRLEEVIRNLLSNAVKYSPGSGLIEIGLQTAPEAAEATLWVRDQGLGIPRDQLSTVFESFIRGRNLEGRDPGGMGLGLYVSREIVERHAGRIWCESTEGVGSTYYVTLPLLPAAEG